jgi:hypothetical protein
MAIIGQFHQSSEGSRQFTTISWRAQPAPEPDRSALISELKDDHPVAQIAVIRAGDVTIVPEKLD